MQRLRRDRGQDARAAAVVVALLAAGLTAVAAVGTSAQFLRQEDWAPAVLALAPAPLAFLVWPGTRGLLGALLWIPFAGTIVPLALGVLA